MAISTTLCGAITPYLFLKTMANIKNKIIYADTDISLHNVEVQLSVQTELMEGCDSTTGMQCSDVNSGDELAHNLVYAHENQSPLNVSVQSNDETEKMQYNNSTLSIQNSDDAGKLITVFQMIGN